MKSLVVLSAVFAVAVAAPYYAVGTRTVYGVPTVYSAPAAVSHQSQVNVHSSPAVIATAPAVVATRTVLEPENTIVSAPAVVAPVQTVVAAPSAVSHQSRVDVRTSEPKYVSTGPVVVAKSFEPAQGFVVSPAVVNVAPAATVYSGGAAVTHQSRVDVKSSPAVITEQVVEPAYVTPVVQAYPTVVEAAPAVVDARSVYVAPTPTFYSAGYIKK
ncbi:cuticle protein 16.5-like [Melitaea cinxia]|uniref:cuticle protein 16.5-like n=1 Tax=Melitaea cinxia TaxID=113334 RepID=UPI001E26FDC4|nr:cuticle protein 16.5-like [Melitaea cinxia]